MTTKPRTVWFDGGWRWRVLRTHRCPHCDKVFADRIAVKQHVKAVHAQEHPTDERPR